MKTSIKKAIATGLIGITAFGGAAFAVPAIASAHGPGGGNRGAKAELVAETLDMTVEELREARAAGQSIADIAGADIDAVVDALVAGVTERIQAKVDAGDLTQAEADEKIAGLEERITEKLNRAPGEGRRGNRGQAPADA